MADKISMSLRALPKVSQRYIRHNVTFKNDRNGLHFIITITITIIIIIIIIIIISKHLSAHLKFSTRLQREVKTLNNYMILGNEKISK